MIILDPKMKTPLKNNSRNYFQAVLYKFKRIQKSKKQKNKEESTKYLQKFSMLLDSMMIIILIWLIGRWQIYWQWDLAIPSIFGTLEILKLPVSLM